MSVSNGNMSWSAAGSGSTVTVTLDAYVYDEDDVEVISVADATGVETTLTKTTDYTTSGIPGASGSVSTVASYAAGNTIYVRRKVGIEGAIKQTADFVEGDAFPEEVVEQVLDRQVMTEQVLNDLIGRSPRFKKTSSKTGLEIDDTTFGANKLMSVNTGGTGFTFVEATEGQTSLDILHTIYDVVIRATDGDYTSMAAWLATSPAGAQSVLYDAQETITATLDIPNNTQVHCTHTARVAAGSGIVTAIEMGDNVQITGRLSLYVTVSLTTGVKFNGNQSDIHNLQIHGLGGTITTAVEIAAGVYRNFAWGDINPTNLTVTNVLTDSSGNDSNDIIIITGTSTPYRSRGAYSMREIDTDNLKIAGAPAAGITAITTADILSNDDSAHIPTNAAVKDLLYNAISAADLLSLTLNTGQVVDTIQTVISKVDDELPTGGAVLDYLTDGATGGDLNVKSLDLQTSISVTSIKDEDNMASDSATALATQQSIKAYVDAGQSSILNYIVGGGLTTIKGHYNVSAQAPNPTGVFFGGSGGEAGKYMFVLDSGGILYRYTLSTYGDIKTASYGGTAADSVDLSATVPNASGLAFDDTGDRVFVCNYSGDTVHYWSLTTGAWDLTSVGAPATIDLGTVTGDVITVPSDISFNSDGSLVYIICSVGGAPKMVECTATDFIAWVETTNQHAINTTGGVSVNPDASRVITAEVPGAGQSILEYYMKTPGDLSTVIYTTANKLINTYDTAVYSICHSATGRDMLVCGEVSATIYQFNSAIRTL